MKKLIINYGGIILFYLVIIFGFFFIFYDDVFAHPINKGIKNPYDLANYNISDRDNNNTTIYISSSGNDSSMYNLNFNSTHRYNISSTITCLSNSNDSLLDIGDCLAIGEGDSDLNYWVVPLCVNKYDFSVKLHQGGCPGCFQKTDNVSILIGDTNSCSFVEENFVGPVQYLSDPFKGTTAYLIFKVKTYQVPNTYLSATAQDYFTLYNNRSDYPLVYRFLTIDNRDGGLYDRDGINSLSLRTNTPDIAVIQNDNVNAPYTCKTSYNRLNTSQGTYFSNNTLTLSSSTLPLIRNFDEKNKFDINSALGRGLSYSNGVYTIDGTSDRFSNQVTNVSIPAGTYKFSYDVVGGNTNNLYMVAYCGNTPHYLETGSILSVDCTITRYQIYVGNNTSTIQFKNLQLESGRNKTSYVPYSVYGFNNDISNYNYSSLQFVETNLVQKGKVNYCVKYLDNWTNKYNVECYDVISGSESSFLGMNSHMHYRIQGSIHNTCLYGFGYLCGDKLPKQLQIQLIDNESSFYFTKPLLYSKNISYNKITGKNEYSIDTDNSIPNYVPPNKMVCTDKNNGNIYDYNSREIIYDSSNSNDTFADEVYLQNEYNNLFGGYELPDKFGLSGLIDIPINFVNQVRDGTCTPIDLKFKIKNNNVNAVTLPCGSTLWNREDIVPFKPFIETFFTGIIVYQIIFNLFFFVRSKRDPIKITHDDGSEELMIL